MQIKKKQQPPQTSKRQQDTSLVGEKRHKQINYIIFWPCKQMILPREIRVHIV